MSSNSSPSHQGAVSPRGSIDPEQPDKLMSRDGSPPELISDIPASRRSSTSSIDTVTNESVIENIAKPKRSKQDPYVPCSSCNLLLFHALEPLLPSDSRRSAEADRKYGNTEDFLLLSSARKCSMCHLLHLVFRAADNSLLDQVIKYDSDGFNTMGQYLPDGGTDIDELVNPGPKVKTHVRAKLKYLGSSKDARVTSLLLRFDVSCKTHASCGYTTTTAYEDVMIFRDKGSTMRADATTDHLDGLRDSLYFLPLDPRLGADGKWGLLASWLERYPKSMPPYDPESLPSRVLDLSQEGQVKLIPMVEIPPQSSYVALSHSWGASQHLTTTSHTLDRHKLSIPLDALPATFKDAVTLTRCLGIFYLWIDALCIIQDNREDWLREARKMGDVFMNAEVVVAAHCAADDSQGFLAEAMSKRSAIKFVEVLEGSSESVWVCRHSKSEVDVTNSRLSKRGWVLQERFLARHTLHFTGNGVFSERHTEVLSEDCSLTSSESVPGAETTFFGPSVLPQLRMMFTGTDDIGEAGGRQTPLEWLALVEMYTNCDLTREEDKLVAISGMASRIHLRTGNIWCAGLWSDRISEGLLWLPEQSLSCPTYPRAPSWSWAAWDGPILYPGTVKDAEFQSKAEFVSVHKTNHSPDAAENVWLDGVGALRIRAKIIPLENVILGNDIVQLGPGPARRGYLTDDNRDLPRLQLSHYVTVNTLRGRRHADKRLKVREESLPPCGWVALDNRYFGLTQGSKLEPYRLQNCCFAVAGIRRVPSGGLVYLGVYLCPVGNYDTHALEYRRIGCGQLSHSFISGESLVSGSWRPDELGWSTLSDDVLLHVPLELSVLSTITIR